jgi:hypothetical protein
MLGIGISYRRSDSKAMIHRIVDRLIAHYGEDAVFPGIGDIPSGVDFRQHLDETLRARPPAGSPSSPPDGRAKVVKASMTNSIRYRKTW